jgi:predicted chitinase
MLISPPFVLARQPNETDDAYVRRCMPATAAVLPGTQIPEGSYPVSYGLGWHGGLHLQAPVGANGQIESVRAIGDGEIIYARRPTPRNENPDDPHNFNPYGDAPAWTDDGCVIIRHTTEIGADVRNQPVLVTFFSIYMHLGELRGAAHRVATGDGDRRVFRKGEIGRAGSICGAAQQLHLEIVCDDDNLERLMGRRSGVLPMDRDGRVDVIYGAVHFRLPVGTAIYGEEPLAHTPVAHWQPPASRQGGRRPPPEPLEAAHTTTEILYIGLNWAHGEGPPGARGDLMVSSHREDGTVIEPPVRAPEAEYRLYAAATSVSSAYPAEGRPAPSAVYELLRFGRVIGPDALNPADVPHWRRIRYSDGEGWVNLNAPGVIKFSDADFPHWLGWRLIDDDTDGDSRCNSAALLELIAPRQQGDTNPPSRDAAWRNLNVEATRRRVARTVCRLPSEWDQSTTRQRWSWLQQEPVDMSPEDFETRMRYLDVLCIDWGAANLGLPAVHWHWEPREFIAHCRRIHWFAASDLERIYPTTSTEIRERYRPAVNQVLRRYGLNTPVRASHFLGQGQVETMGLQLMVEGSASFSRSPGHGSFQPEIQGYYADPRDLYGYFHNYERVGNDLGNVARSQLRDSRGGVLPVVLGRDTRGRPVVTSPTVAQVDATQSTVGDGMKFRGRGFKQLTGLSNYTQYWVYRGWLTPGADFDNDWWVPPRRTTDRPRRVPNIPDPQRVSLIPFNCIDSGGQFAARNGIHQAGDGGTDRANADAVSRIINRWDQPSFQRRFDSTVATYELLGP